MDVRRKAMQLMIAIVMATFGSCTRSGNGPVAPPDSNTDFEGDLTQFNEACRDSIVFSSYRFAGINMMYNDGTGLHGILTPWDWPISITWSPKKWKIFFIVDTAQDFHGRGLFMMKWSGGDLRRLTPMNENVWAAACAPDGQKIVYTVLGDSSKGKLRVSDPSGAYAHDITGFVLWNQSNKLSWSPDSKRVVFDGFPIVTSKGKFDGLGVANADGTFAGPLFVPDHNCYMPDWSTVNGKILYASFVLVDTVYYLNIFYLDPVTQLSHQITSLRGTAEYPHWSQDGSRVVFNFKQVGESRSHIYVMNLDGSGLTQLTSGDYSDSNPAW